MSSSALPSQLTPFFQALSRASESVLLLDYDGTLAPFRINRDEAYPYPGVTQYLQQIVTTCGTRVVVISGRRASDIFPFLDLRPRPEVWGSHGLQRVKSDGTTDTAPLDDQSRDGLSEAIQWLDAQELRHLAEFKPGAIALHWRGLTQSAIEALRSRVVPAWKPIAQRSGLNLLPFDGGIEIRAREADKGKAVSLLLNEISPEASIAYLGDDATDEAAFRAMKDRGLTVLVRPVWRETAAQFWLKPPEELLAFLDTWLKACVEKVKFGG